MTVSNVCPITAVIAVSIEYPKIIANINVNTSRISAIMNKTGVYLLILVLFIAIYAGFG